MSPVVGLVLIAAVLILAHAVLLVAWETWFRPRTRDANDGGAMPHAAALRAVARLRQRLAGGDKAAPLTPESASASSAGQDEAWSELIAKLADQAVDAQESLEQQLRSAEARLAEQSELLAAQIAAARTDALTGLANRRAFDDELTARMNDARQQGGDLCVLLLDIDHFKQLNDQWGHAVGDLALKRVATVLSRSLRRGDAVARYGGEEFGIILPGAAAPRAAEVAERARQAVSQHPLLFDGREIRLSVSAGFAQADDSENARSLVRRADEALYAAKAAGRNCCGWHDGERAQPLRTVVGPAKSATGDAVCDATGSLAVEAVEALAAGIEERTEAELADLCEEVRRRMEQLGAATPQRDRRRV